MACVVCNLTKEAESKSHVCLHDWWIGVERVVDKVSNVCSKAPVVGAVFYEIEEWHSGMTKPVHKECFIDSLCIVTYPVHHGQCLCPRFLSATAITYG